MATPIGHGLLGLAIAQALARNEVDRRRAFWLANVAWLPDLDVLPGLLVGNLSQFHHGASHSLTAAAVFSVAGFLGFAWWRRQWSPGLLLLLFSIYASHIVLDFVTLDLGAPFGVPLFWPWISETYESPWMLLPNVQHTSAPLLSLHNIILAIQEALVFLPLAGLVFVLKDWWHTWPRAAAWFCGGWFLIAVIASILWLRNAS